MLFRGFVMFLQQVCLNFNRVFPSILFSTTIVIERLNYHRDGTFLRNVFNVFSNFENSPKVPNSIKNRITNLFLYISIYKINKITRFLKFWNAVEKERLQAKLANCSKPCVTNAIRSPSGFWPLNTVHPIIAKSPKFPHVPRSNSSLGQEWLERNGLQSAEGHVRMRVVSRLIKAARTISISIAGCSKQSAHRARYRSLFESAAQFRPCNATNRIGWSSHHRGRRWSVPRPETRHYTRVYRAHNPVLAGCQSFDVMRPDRPRLSWSFIDAYTPVCARFKRWFRDQRQRDPPRRIETSIPHRVREIE